MAWLSDVIALGALVVSVIAFTESRRAARGAKNSYVSKLTTEVRQLVKDLCGRFASTRDEWHQYLAAAGSYHSGFRVKIDRDLESLEASYREIAAWSDRLPSISHLRSIDDFNKREVELLEAKSALEAIARDLSDHRAEARMRAADLRTRSNQG